MEVEWMVRLIKHRVLAPEDWSFIKCLLYSGCVNIVEKSSKILYTDIQCVADAGFMNTICLY